MKRIKYYKTSIPNMEVEVRLGKKGTKYILRGIAVDKATKRMLVGAKESTITINDPNEFDRFAAVLVIRVTRAFENHLKTLNIQANPELENIYTETYDAIPEDNRKQLCPEVWADSTAHVALTYFRRNLLPLLDKYGLEPSYNDMEYIRNTLTQNTLNSGNAGSDKNASIEKTVFRNIENCNRLYVQLRRYNPLLPDVTIPHNPRTAYVAVESCKELPLEVRLKFAKLLFTDIKDSMSGGAVMMLTGLLRTAEAAAPKYKDLDIRDDLVALGVICQAEHRDTTGRLKSTHSYRMVIMPKYAADFFREKIAYLKEQGFTQEQIDIMPVCAKPGDLKTQATANELSVYIRVALTECGCNAAYWDATIALMEMNPDTDEDGTPLKDVGAYALRRDGCTRLCNVCCMDPQMVDALMGHKLPYRCTANWYEYIRNPDNWAQIAVQMERCVLYGSHSAHPAYRPIYLQENGYAQKDAVSKVKIQIGEKLIGKKLHITVCPAMPGEAIETVSSYKPKVLAKMASLSQEGIPVCEDLVTEEGNNEKGE